MKTIVSISGTSRPDNYTSHALAIVNERLRQDGAKVTTFDARQLALAFPGQPTTDDARRLREAIGEADAIVLATPEYHGSFAAMTKLIIENLGFPSALEGKPMSLLGVASGRIGAIKTLEQLRGVCAHVGAIVLPGAVSIAGIRNAFDSAGQCTNDTVEEMLVGLADNTLKYIEQYICPKFILEAQVRDDEESEPWVTSI
ncbi:MAG: NADPH-dependent FMN reductase [Bradymonadaceae bacterium]